MRDWIDLGASPWAESCAQLGTDGYYGRAEQECRAYIALLRRVFDDEPEGAKLDVSFDPHDFGTYLSVICYYEPSNEAALTYAFRCESDGPAEWDDIARRELGLLERSEE